MSIETARSLSRCNAERARALRGRADRLPRLRFIKRRHLLAEAEAVEKETTEAWKREEEANSVSLRGKPVITVARRRRFSRKS